MGKIYPVDIFGVKKIGIEEWIKNYNAPITGKEFQDIYENIFHFYISTLKKYDNKIVYWLAVSNIKLTYFISSYIFNLLRLSRLKKEGYEYVIGKNKEKISDIFSTLTELTNFKLIDSSTINMGFKERIKNALRMIKHNLPGIMNRNFFKNFSNQYFIIGSKFQGEVVSYCNTNGISPILIFPMLFAKSSLKNFPLNSQHSEMQEFVNDFLSLVGEQYPIIRNSTFKDLEEKINECFKYSSFFFHNIVVFLKKFKPKTLLVAGIGHSIHRLFCSAWRYSGGEVVGFVHGNAYCTSYSPVCVTDGFLSILNQYVASSYGYEKILKRAVEDFSIGLKTDARITNNKQNIYYPIFKELQKCKPVREIKKVMLIGWPMDNKMYVWFPERYTFSNLYLELHLIKLLKNAGYYVIYKAHPDRINEVESIYEKYADKVLMRERFEDSCDSADCIFFTHSHTTTFGFALLTKKPIVLIKVKGETWFPRALELLRKRCCIVDAESNGTGKIVINDHDVIDAVKTSINNISYDVLHEFAF